MLAGNRIQQFVYFTALGANAVFHMVFTNACQGNTIYKNRIVTLGRPGNLYGKIHFHSLAGKGCEILSERTAVELPVVHNEEYAASSGIGRNIISELIDLIALVDLQVAQRQVADGQFLAVIITLNRNEIAVIEQRLGIANSFAIISLGIIHIVGAFCRSSRKSGIVSYTLTVSAGDLVKGHCFNYRKLIHRFRFGCAAGSTGVGLLALCADRRLHSHHAVIPGMGGQHHIAAGRTNASASIPISGRCGHIIMGRLAGRNIDDNALNVVLAIKVRIRP